MHQSKNICTFTPPSKSVSMHKYIISIIIILLLSASPVDTNAQENNKKFFVFLNSNPDKENISEDEVGKLQTEHLNNITKLADEGKLLAAGPIEGGGGIFILVAEDMDQAKNYLETDPAIAANRFNIEIFPFNIYNGKICGATEPYEMVTYQLVRFKTENEDPNALGIALRDNRTFMAHQQYETKQLVVYGKFSDDNDGVLIMNVPDLESAEAIINSHPSVINGSISYKINTLWIAKGTFCE